MKKHKGMKEIVDGLGHKFSVHCANQVTNGGCISLPNFDKAFKAVVTQALIEAEDYGRLEERKEN